MTRNSQAARALTPAEGGAAMIRRVCEGMANMPDGLDLEHGGCLPSVDIAWRLTGPEGAPVVAVLGGISAHRFVAGGDEVQEGQALCTVEAMKMENILRAERKGIVKKVNASAGDSLAVDEVIMEFE